MKDSVKYIRNKNSSIMKKLFLAIVMAALSLSASAQHEEGTWNIQPKVGINVAKVTKGGFDTKVGFVGGVELEYQAWSPVSLSAAVLYSGQGAKKWNLAYLNVPILANFYVVKGFALKTGVQPGFKLSDEDMDVRKFDFSIPVGASYEYANWQLDARYNIGLTKVWKGATNKNSVFQITLGYKFEI